VTEAYLGLGSNLGNRLAFLQRAVAMLDDAAGVLVTGVSRVYETDPVGGTEQPRFLNAVVRVETSLTPRGLLDLATEIERDGSRVRAERWGPRTLDLDILLFGSREVEEPDLVIPHPRMADRAFVLIPLLDLAPGGALPDGRPLAGLLAALGPVSGVAEAGGMELVR